MFKKQSRIYQYNFGAVDGLLKFLIILRIYLFLVLRIIFWSNKKENYRLVFSMTNSTVMRDRRNTRYLFIVQRKIKNIPIQFWCHWWVATFFNHTQHALIFGAENHLYTFLRIIYKQIKITLYMIIHILSLGKPILNFVIYPQWFSVFCLINQQRVCKLLQSFICC